MSERAFRQQVIDLCHYTGWRYYFTWTSMHSPAGFPDLILVRGVELIAAELKSERGRLSPAQQSWIDALQHAGVECHVWRTSALDVVIARLSTDVDKRML